jgi:hypothetical protein
LKVNLLCWDVGRGHSPSPAAGTAAWCATPACRACSPLWSWPTHGEGRFARLFRRRVKGNLVILDHWAPDRLTANQRRDLKEIVEDATATDSALISSQLRIDQWHDVAGEPIVTRGYRIIYSEIALLPGLDLHITVRGPHLSTACLSVDRGRCGGGADPDRVRGKRKLGGISKQICIVLSSRAQRI